MSSIQNIPSDFQQSEIKNLRDALKSFATKRCLESSSVIMVILDTPPIDSRRVRAFIGEVEIDLRKEYQAIIDISSLLKLPGKTLIQNMNFILTSREQWPSEYLEFLDAELVTKWEEAGL